MCLYHVTIMYNGKYGSTIYESKPITTKEKVIDKKTYNAFMKKLNNKFGVQGCAVISMSLLNEEQ